MSFKSKILFSFFQYTICSVLTLRYKLSPLLMYFQISYEYRLVCVSFHRHEVHMESSSPEPWNAPEERRVIQGQPEESGKHSDRLSRVYLKSQDCFSYSLLLPSSIWGFPILLLRCHLFIHTHESQKLVLYSKSPWDKSTSSISSSFLILSHQSLENAKCWRESIRHISSISAVVSRMVYI